METHASANGVKPDLATLRQYTAMVAAYRRRFGFSAVITDTEGALLAGRLGCGHNTPATCNALRRRIVSESLRWGEPFMDLCPRGFLVWGIPLMVNQRVVGGMVASARVQDPLQTAPIRQAAEGLLALAGEHNGVNLAWLARNRIKADQERRRAEVIHDTKGRGYDNIRAVYLQEEPALIDAIRNGARGEARAIINRILVGIYFVGRDRLDLLKSLVMELVVMMSRAAVEAGADPSVILGGNYRGLSGLAEIEDDEALTAWLTTMLERVMDAIRTHRHYPSTLLLSRALRYMQEHLADDLTRDQVARIAGLSPSHFSHLMQAKLGTTFTRLLARYRVNLATRQLARTTDSIAEIALACGFPDQSYFTKVFKRETGATPLAYRKSRR